MNLAGPLANLVLAVALLAATRQFYNPEHPVFWSAVAFLAFLQITALVLNLLPILASTATAPWNRTSARRPSAPSNRPSSSAS